MRRFYMERNGMLFSESVIGLAAAIPVPCRCFQVILVSKLFYATIVTAADNKQRL